MQLEKLNFKLVSPVWSVVLVGVTVTPLLVCEPEGEVQVIKPSLDPSASALM